MFLSLGLHGEVKVASFVEFYFLVLVSNQLVTPAELSERFSDIRFVRLSAIKYVNALYIFVHSEFDRLSFRSDIFISISLGTREFTSRVMTALSVEFSTF